MLLITTLEVSMSPHLWFERAVRGTLMSCTFINDVWIVVIIGINEVAVMDSAIDGNLMYNM